ncbi:hypothetical protein NDU88_007296 [Pleurodeles waltl]|uniref:Uncharacterized protein n=1 Tax=Pleurodeles waltl TaxID=8319 RepID=A0AAV7LXA5_PLEWA|nr:hypothetical protein NDU88_007296 [Pleurodeles waltl]
MPRSVCQFYVPLTADWHSGSTVQVGHPEFLRQTGSVGRCPISSLGPCELQARSSCLSCNGPRLNVRRRTVRYSLDHASISPPVHNVAPLKI